jgi:hypothetical protein
MRSRHPSSRKLVRLAVVIFLPSLSGCIAPAGAAAGEPLNAAAKPGPSPEKTMESPKRRVPRVDPVEEGGVRYEIVRGARARHGAARMNTLLNKRRVFKSAMAFLTVLLAMEVSAMGLNKILFSNVHGVVLERGKPVPGALVTRYFNFGLTDESKTDTTRTDSNGVFTFPQIGRLSLLASIVPAQPDVPQKISITHGGKEYLAWLFTKKNYDANGELRGKPIDMVCELTNERTYDPETKVHGICQLK